MPVAKLKLKNKHTIMIDSKQYAEKIVEVAYYNFPLVHPKETVLKCIDALIVEYSNQKNKWFNVKDKLPTERVEFVLLFNADAPKYNQCVYQGVWFLQDNKFKSDTNHNLLGTVTHWMRLPSPPISTTEA